MKPVSALFCLQAVALFMPPLSPASAQMIDASKITCDQFVHGKLGVPRTLAAWISGFYNGKRDNRIIDTQLFERNMIKLEDFCYQEKNFDRPVLEVIDEVTEKPKSK
jgi:acid stress chaperone HdeB